MKIKEILNEGKSVADLNLNYKGGDLDISSENLTSLKGSPSEIFGFFNCEDNDLESLIGGPQIVRGYYNCHNSGLSSLTGSPQKVGGYFDCGNCLLTTLDFGPQIVNDDFNCYGNEIKSFKNVFKYIKQIKGTFNCYANPIKEGLLHILLIKGVTKIVTPYEQIDDIVNDYLKNNASGTLKSVMDAQRLIMNAKLRHIPEVIYME